MGWYALSCRPGETEMIIRSCRQHLSAQALEDAFQFSYERMKKYLGEWHVDSYPMFPNYIFLQSENPELLSEELEQYRAIVNVLESGRLLLQIHPDEERVMRLLCGDSHHMPMSQGVIADDGVQVTAGPLKGREAMIRKVDRHKRIAILNLQMAKGLKDIWAGLEVTAKTDRTE